MYSSAVVTTTHGPVRGRVTDAVTAFKGIRYGADTAAYRFQPPRPPAPWTEVVNAFEFGPTAPQDHPEQSTDRATNPWLQMMGLTDNLPESEDCLFLNVWTPSTAAQAAEAGQDAPARPVLVWVHSGGYSDNSGSSPSVDGAHLAREHDLVTVSFNHRLGVLGYTQLVDPAEAGSPYATSGNVGQLDIVAALEWVRDNIAAFGGDPGNVTLAGQSGGAMKISCLLAMPRAQGLFHKAVLQSGTTARVLEPRQAAAVTARLRASAALTPDAGPEELAGMDLKALMRAYKATAEGLTTFGPVLDGRVIPAHPFSPASVALSGDKPLILGDLDTEATLFLLHSRDALVSAGPEEVTRRLAAVAGHDLADALVSAITAGHGPLDGYELAVQVLSDGLFTGPAHLAALRRAAGASAPTWRYRNALRTPAQDGALMSPHELDVALTFGNIHTATGLNGDTPEAHAVSRLLGATWAAFARDGEPVDGRVLGAGGDVEGGAVRVGDDARPGVDEEDLALLGRVGGPGGDRGVGRVAVAG
ncbi:carboxylesterase/lipase family protein, partial [Actinomyces sp. 186855]|uniref:carboxylesterase/lipase family protein n=1 Tax=Actinomyces sp. 186855 TaxID=2761164 RepID=UPI0020172155|nr:carboxylesterase/lipase family protein [Actinomyces sp. 186855]